MEREGYVIRDEYLPHFLTFRVTDWVDIFTRVNYRDIVVNSLEFCRQNFGLRIYGYVVMSNHVHAILHQPDGKLSPTITSFKKFTGGEIIRTISAIPESRETWMLKRFELAKMRSGGKGDHLFWKRDNHPKQITTRDFFLQKLNYIHDNPVRAKIVTQQEHYIYSSAAYYNGLPALIDIDLWDGAIQYK